MLIYLLSGHFQEAILVLILVQGVLLHDTNVNIPIPAPGLDPDQDTDVDPTLIHLPDPEVGLILLEEGVLIGPLDLVADLPSPTGSVTKEIG